MTYNQRWILHFK